MKYTLEWLPEARRDLAEIISYIASTFGTRTANKTLDKIDETASLLTNTPLIGEVFGPNDSYRVFHTKRSSIYYRVKESSIIIATVIDNRRNPDTIASILSDRNNQQKQ